MSALDGNAIGGLLHDIFGVEMTVAGSVCAACGAARPLAELQVYRRAPGIVVRCRSCDALLIVVVERRGIQCLDLRGLARLDPPS